MTTNATITKRKKKIDIHEFADFWCGGGGTSTGLKQALEELGITNYKLTAVNHWEIAVETHTRNHPDARHYCKAVDSLNPLELFPQTGTRKPKIRILIASPECTHHSNARGGKPRDAQKRADANDIMRWVDKLDIEDIFIENVKEFIDWGPLNSQNKPIQRLKGMYFLNFINFLKYTYNVEWRIVNCADFGDATTRERFFLIARKKSLRKPIKFPEPTHAHKDAIAAQSGQGNFFNPKTKEPWRPARDIIDWSLKGESIFLTPEDVKERKLNIRRPLSPNTLKRIIAGLCKYSLSPFFVNQKGEKRRDRGVEEPTFTQCGSNHQYLVQLESYLLQFFGERATQKERVKSLDNPLWTITGQGRMGIATPFMFNMAHNGKHHDGKSGYVYDMERPIPTIETKAMFGLIEGYLIKYFTGSDACSVKEPLPTITANYEHLGLIQTVPFLTKYHGAENEAHSIDEPLSTITTKDRLGIATPFIVPSNHGKNDLRAHSIDEPMKTITAVDGWNVAMPFIAKLKNNQTAQSIAEPLGTLTTKDSYALVIPQFGIALDILFRMLQPHELAEAMSFPKNYSFAGTRADQVKQIGNAVPVKAAKAHMKFLLET